MFNNAQISKTWYQQFARRARANVGLSAHQARWTLIFDSSSSTATWFPRSYLVSDVRHFEPSDVQFLEDDVICLPPVHFNKMKKGSSSWDKNKEVSCVVVCLLSKNVFKKL